MLMAFAVIVFGSGNPAASADDNEHHRFSKYGRFEVPWIDFDTAGEEIDDSDHIYFARLKNLIGQEVTLSGSLHNLMNEVWLTDEVSQARIRIESYPCEDASGGNIAYKYIQIAYRENPYEVLDDGVWIAGGKTVVPDWRKYDLGQKKVDEIMTSFKDEEEVTVTGRLCHYQLIRVGIRPVKIGTIGVSLPSSHFFFEPTDIKITHKK